MGSDRNTLILEVLTEGDLQGVQFVLHPDQRLLFGRTRGADIIVPSILMSRRHCWVWFEDGHWMLQDAGSTSGVFIDETSASGGPRELPYASLVRMGGVRFISRRGAPDLRPTIPVGTPARTPEERALADNQSPLLDRQGEVQTFADRFELRASLGRGTRCATYEVFDRRGRTTNESGLHVLKIYDAGMTAEQEAEFLRASTSKTLMYDTHFVPHRAWGVTGGRAWLAMEKVTGLTLSQRLAQKPLTMLESVKLGGALAYSLGKLHGEGFFHRNLKPSNILLWKGDPTYPHLSDILVDIGPRKRPDKEPPPDAMGFVAPHPALTAGDFEASDDVYSLAAVVYLCVAGCMPAPGHDLHRERRIFQPLVLPQDLRELRPDAPAVLAELLSRALSPHRVDRPKTIHEFGFALLPLEKDDALGFGRNAAPFEIRYEAGEPRRAVIAPRKTVDPFTDETFQEEILELARPRCPPDTVWGVVHSIFRGHAPPPHDARPACALCGQINPLTPSVEIRPNGFSVKNHDEPAREPFVCGRCLDRDHAIVARAILDTARSLEGQDDQPNRPLGPTRKELREGILALYAASRPTLDPALKCPACGRVGETLRGVRSDLCLRCVSTAREVQREWSAARQREAGEQLRREYARLFVRAEARRKRGLLLWSPTPESAVRLPEMPRLASIGDGFREYDAIDRLHSPPRAAIDACALAIAGAIDRHTLTALGREDAKETGNPAESLGHSGVPGLAQRFLDAYEPGPEARERLVTAVFVMSELLRAGYRFIGQKDVGEWVDDTHYFTVFHDLADKLAGT